MLRWSSLKRFLAGLVKHQSRHTFIPIFLTYSTSEWGASCRRLLNKISKYSRLLPLFPTLQICKKNFVEEVKMYKCRGVKILKVWKAHQFSAPHSGKRNKIATLTCSVWCLPYFQLCQALHIDGGPCQMCSRTLWNPGADCAIQPSCNWIIFAQTTSKQVRNKWAGKQLYRRKISQRKYDW